MRKLFDQQLELLVEEMISMGALVEEAINLACESLITNNDILAKQVMDADVIVDKKERNIEALCLKLLLTQHPIAKDLRKVSSALKMITDMERIGDQAADICEIVTMIGDSEKHNVHTCIKDMANTTMNMVRKAIDSYASSDLVLAQAVIAGDDIVDDQFMHIKTDLITLLQEQPNQGQYALDLLMIAKYFERIGDHAVNIAEWVEFSLTGQYKGEVLQ